MSDDELIKKLVDKWDKQSKDDKTILKLIPIAIILTFGIAFFTEIAIKVVIFLVVSFIVFVVLCSLAEELGIIGDK